MRYISINFGKKVRRRLLLIVPCVLLAAFTIFGSGDNRDRLSCSPKRSVDNVSRSDLLTTPDPAPSCSDAVSESDSGVNTTAQAPADDSGGTFATAPSQGSQSGDETADEPELPTYASLERLSISETLARPLDRATISSLFGYRVNPLTGKYSFHSGLDLAAAQGSSIYAVLGGTVSFTGYESGYGNYIIIDHTDGISSLYAHCSELLASTGDAVEKGDVIALVGSTGSSTGPHLHIELRKNNKRCDPYELIGGMYA